LISLYMRNERVLTAMLRSTRVLRSGDSRFARHAGVERSMAVKGRQDSQGNSPGNFAGKNDCCTSVKSLKDGHI
jgi:hypothetical protein